MLMSMSFNDELVERGIKEICPDGTYHYVGECK
jgi:hypothetical protein